MPAGTRKRGRPRDATLGARRRAEIIAAATRVFAANGYANGDVQLVADALGVGKGTIYRYFPTKRDLFVACVDEGMRRLDESVLAAAMESADPLESMILAFRRCLLYFEENPDVGELLAHERAELRDRGRSLYFEHRDRTIEPWRAVVRQLVAEGRLRPLDPRLYTDTVSDILYGWALASRFGGKRAAIEVRARELLDLLFEGILSDEERTRRRRRTAPRTREKKKGKKGDR